MSKNEAIKALIEGKLLAEILIETKGLHLLKIEDLITLKRVKEAWLDGYTEDEKLLKRLELSVYDLSLLIGTLSLHERTLLNLKNQAMLQEKFYESKR